MGQPAAEELKTVELMIRLFCRGRHGRAELCPDCAALLAAAGERLRRCPHSPKPSCRNCKTHCYPPPLRERIREVMRYAGPRLLLRAPLTALRHYLKRS